MEKARLRVWNPAGPEIRSAVWQPGRRTVPRVFSRREGRTPQ